MPPPATLPCHGVSCGCIPTGPPATVAQGPPGAPGDVPKPAAAGPASPGCTGIPTVCGTALLALWLGRVLAAASFNSVSSGMIRLDSTAAATVHVTQAIQRRGYTSCHASCDASRCALPPSAG